MNDAGRLYQPWRVRSQPASICPPRSPPVRSPRNQHPGRRTRIETSPLAPIEDPLVGAITLGELTEVRLDLMPAAPKSGDQPQLRPRRITERHQRAGFAISPGLLAARAPQASRADVHLDHRLLRVARDRGFSEGIGFGPFGPICPAPF
jgi:hypothetical protein